METTKVAFVGVGDISGIYLENLTKLFKQIEVVGLCDLIREKAERAQERYGIPKIYDTMYDAFADEEVDIILNLTRPYEHFEVTKAALEAGKHVYSEKPLGGKQRGRGTARSFGQGEGPLHRGRTGYLPGRFHSNLPQTHRRRVIGEPVGFTASMICRGHESWHPQPRVLLQVRWRTHAGYGTLLHHCPD